MRELDKLVELPEPGVMARLEGMGRHDYQYVAMHYTAAQLRTYGQACYEAGKQSAAENKPGEPPNKKAHDMLIDLRAAAAIGRPITHAEVEELEQSIISSIKRSAAGERVDLTEDGVDWQSALENATDRIVAATSESAWYEQFVAPVAVLLKCLPSTSADGNEHIIRKLRALLDSQKSGEGEDNG